MPTYEYRCDNGHTFEVMQRMTDPPVTTCEVCGAPVQRVFHPIAVHFKGKGFYNTDYGTRRRQRETLAAAEGTSKDGSSKESSSSDSSSDSSSSSSSNGAGSGDGKKDAKKDGGAAAAKTGKAAPKSG
jgi:putative FmdB family regulatory protein